MSVLELSRWQFGITTVYHFLFVPLVFRKRVTAAPQAPRPQQPEPDSR